MIDLDQWTLQITEDLKAKERSEKLKMEYTGQLTVLCSAPFYFQHVSVAEEPIVISEDIWKV